MSLEACWDSLGTLSYGLPQCHGHGSWLVCEVALASTPRAFRGLIPKHEKGGKKGREGEGGGLSQHGNPRCWSLRTLGVSYMGGIRTNAPVDWIACLRTGLCSMLLFLSITTSSPALFPSLKLPLPT